MGKTSMLHALAILAREAGYHVRYISCSENSDFDSTFMDVARHIPLIHHGDLDPGMMRRGASFADLVTERPVNVSQMCDLLGKISGARLLVIIDEFDRATEPAFRNAIAQTIKNLSDRGAPAQLVIGGVASNLNELITFIPSIRRNLTGIAVTAMTPAELEQIIARGEKLSGLAYAPLVRQQMIDLSVGSPYLLNLLAYESGARAIDHGRDSVDADDLEQSAAMIADDMRGRLDYRTERQLAALEAAMPAGQLRAIAQQAVSNFGRLEEQAIAALARISPALTVEGSDGAVRFCDDALPLILWLDGRDNRPALELNQLV
jgi:hypothetical protein